MVTDLGVTSFEDMPDDLKTPEICLEAVKQRGLALRYVPEALKAIINERLTGKEG